MTNRAGTQRARRLAITYVVALAVIFAGIDALARSAPSAGSVGVGQDLELFATVALVLAIVGVVVSLSSAPLAVERTGGETIVHGVFGYRRRFPEGPGLTVRVLRRYPAGLLSSAPVESVEIATKGVRRTYLLEEGLLPEQYGHPPGA
jgi:hypothetical protein